MGKVAEQNEKNRMNPTNSGVTDFVRMRTTVALGLLEMSHYSSIILKG